MKSRLTKKGIAYILDAFLAMVIVSLLFLVIQHVQNGSGEDFTQKLQLARTGSDIVHVLSQDGTLDTLNSAGIEEKIRALLPPQYNMRLKMQGTFLPGILVVETNTSSNDNQFIASGSRIVALKAGTSFSFAKAEYEVWQ